MKDTIKLPWNAWTDKLTGSVEPEHVVMYTINNSTPVPFIKRVISTDVKGTGRSAVITATVEVFDGNTMSVVLEPNLLGGWGYMFKSDGKNSYSYSYDRDARCWRRLRHFGRPSALTRRVKATA